MTNPISAESARAAFPILNGQGTKIDWELVADHGQQAWRNHSQTVERLAQRGGLSWCELHAVLHNRDWQKMDTNEAMIACRALETRYLAAVAQPDLSAENTRLRALVGEAKEVLKPVVVFIKAFDAKPISQVGDGFYGIHAGTEFEATLHLSDLRAASSLLTKLEGENG